MGNGNVERETWEVEGEKRLRIGEWGKKGQ